MLSFEPWIQGSFIGSVLGAPGQAYLLVGDLRTQNLRPGLYAVRIPDSLLERYYLPTWQKITLYEEVKENGEGMGNERR